MAKFKVGDVVSLKDGYSVPSGASGNRAVVVEVLRPAGGDFNYWLRFDGGREREQHGDQLRLANAARNAVIEKKLPPRGAGVYIEQQGGSFAVGPTNDGWSVANYGGEGVNFAHGFKTVSEAKSWCSSKGYKVEDVILANSIRSRNAYAVDKKGRPIKSGMMLKDDDGDKFRVGRVLRGNIVEDEWGNQRLETNRWAEIVQNSIRSRNAVVQKALNATGDKRDYYVVDEFGNAADGSKTPLPFDRASELFLKLTGSKSGNGKWGIIRRGESASRARDWYGNIVSWNADTSVLRETAVNGKFKVGDRVIGELRTPSSVGTVVRVEKFRLMKVKFDEDGTIFTVDQNKFVPYTNSLRTTNAVVAKALNARAVCNETIEGVFKGLDSGKYDSVAVAPRDNGFPEVRRYGGRVGFSYGDEDELRAMIKSGKYVELLFYKNHSLKGRIPLNARRVARNFTQNSEFEVGDVVRFRDSVRSVPHDETYTVVKVSGNNVTIKGGRDDGTSVEFKDNLEIA